MSPPLLALLGSALAVCPSPDRGLPEPVRGIVLSLHDSDPRRSYRQAVREIGGLGANAVSIMPTWVVKDVRSSEVRPGAATPAQIEESIQAARSEGLAILLMPTLRLERMRRGEWRGTIAPRDWDAWFSSYGRLLVDLARTGEAHQVDALGVGSELCSAERHEGRWRALIAEVRAVFHGSLTYQANWDHREAPAFLDDLDVLGSNAYFELVPSVRSPSVEQLVEAWQPHRAELLGWAARRGQPLLLTEVGYPSVLGSAGRPWDYARKRPVDVAAQRRAYEAFFQVWDGEPASRGFFLYEWWGEGGSADPGYTPRGKPALAVVERRFRPGSEVGAGSRAGPSPRASGREPAEYPDSSAAPVAGELPSRE